MTVRNMTLGHMPLLRTWAAGVLAVAGVAAVWGLAPGSSVSAPPLELALPPGAGAASGPAGKGAVPKTADPDPPLDPAGNALRKRIERLLAAGKVEDALKTARDAVFAKGTPGERKEYVDLHMTLGRQLFAAEDFRRGEEMLRKVLLIDERNETALRLLGGLEAARAEVPAMLERAGQFRAVERFGQAAKIYTKVVSLLPERARDLGNLILECERGAADQHYRVGNWPEAFAHFSAAAAGLDEDRQTRRLHAVILHLSGLMGRGRVPDGLMSRCLEDAVAILRGRPDPVLGNTLLGLGSENEGQWAKAIQHYQLAVGAGAAAKAPPAATNTDAAKMRGAALAEVRKRLVRLGPEHRPALWRESAPGDWLVRETDRFIIHHHNDRVALRVADALEFWFVELLNDWQLPLEKFVGWRPKLKIYVHRDEADYRAKTGAEAFVPAFGRKPKRGVRGADPEVHCWQSHPGLLSSILPHELAHMMVAWQVKYAPIPLAIDEGFALLAEPDWMRAFHHRVGLDDIRRNGPQTVATLLEEPKFGDANVAAVFYARSFLLAEFLRSRSEPVRLLAAVESLPAADARVPLAGALGLKSAEELETAWRKAWGR